MIIISHNYVIDVSANRDLVVCSNLHNHYVYHSYELSDGLTYIPLRHFFL